MRKYILTISASALISLTSVPTLYSQTRGRARTPAPRQSQPVTTQTATTGDGRKVILKSDGTWQYADDTAPERITPPPAAKQNGTLALEAGLVYRSGDVKPVARTEFHLLDKELAQLLQDAGVRPPEKSIIAGTGAGGNLAFSFALAARYNSLPDNQPFYLAAMEAIKPHIVKTVTTDFSGKATIDVVPAGSYYLMGISATPRGFAFWNLPVEIKAGQNSLVLDQNNAAYAN